MTQAKTLQQTLAELVTHARKYCVTALVSIGTFSRGDRPSRACSTGRVAWSTHHPSRSGPSLLMGLLADRWIAVVGAGIGSGAALYYLSRPRGPPVPPPEDTDFGAYLRDLSVGLPQPAPQGGQDAYEDTSFEAYLRAGAFKAAGADQETNAGVVASGPSVAPDAVPVTIVFGTEFGFSKEVAERLAEKLKSAGKNYECVGGLAWVGQGVFGRTSWWSLAGFCGYKYRARDIASQHAVYKEYTGD